jgi:hypothetical protein
MVRFLLGSPFLIIALFLGGFSTFLACKGEYEAAMAGAGVAVATATVKPKKDEESDDIDETPQVRWYREQCEELKNERRRQEETLRWEKEKLIQIIERAEDIRRHEREMTREIVELKGDLGSLNQRFEEQAKIKVMELEIEKLRIEKQLLEQNKELLSLPESKLEVSEAESPNMQIMESLEIERIPDDESI